jgi:large subunit ribosomal protein L31
MADGLRAPDWSTEPISSQPLRFARRVEQAVEPRVGPSPTSGTLALPEVAVTFAGFPAEVVMKSGIHPEYHDVVVRCSCGNEFATRSTNPKIHVEICSNCHPFYTGKEKLVDAAGRVDRFLRKYGKRA